VRKGLKRNLKGGDHREVVLTLADSSTLVIQVKGWDHLNSLDWAADGKGFFVGAGVHGGTVFLRVDLQGNTHALWKSPRSAWTPSRPSPDGHHIAIQDYRVDGNLWMIENF